MPATALEALEREVVLASRRVSWSTVRQIVWAEAESSWLGRSLLGGWVSARAARAAESQTVALDDLRTLELELLPGIFGGES